jgi:hypothetical protein
MSLESMEKTAYSAVGSPADARPAPPRTTGNTADQNRLNLAEESRSIYGTSWNWKVKKEIPAKSEPSSSRWRSLTACGDADGRLFPCVALRSDGQRGPALLRGARADGQSPRPGGQHPPDSGQRQGRAHGGFGDGGRDHGPRSRHPGRRQGLRSSGKARSVGELARRERIDSRSLRRLIPLGFLSPRIIEAIAEGRQPVELTLEALTRRIDLPLLWSAQEQALGIEC